MYQHLEKHYCTTAFITNGVMEWFEKKGKQAGVKYITVLGDS